MPTLRLLQLNVWSGSTYELDWDARQFSSYETPSDAETRYSSLLALVKKHEPDVLTLNECMPSPDYATRLARDLGFSCYTRTALAGIVVGPFHFPSAKITEGDAVLAKPEFHLTPLGRQALTGWVLGESLSFNTDNATQILAASIEKGGRTFAIGW